MLSLEGKTVIAVAPHVDDVELGAGATIYRLARSNDVYYVGLSLPPDIVKDEFMEEFEESASILGIDPDKIILRDYDPRNLFEARTDILQLLYDLGQRLEPDLVFVPNSHDIHQSHEVVHAEACRAFKYNTILGYELPWNNMRTGATDIFVTLTEEEVEAKTAAINAFRTQKHRVFFANDIVHDLARVRGKQIDEEFAECFEAIRLIL